MELTIVVRVAIGLVLVVEGMDKFYNKLADWPMYTAPQILNLLPITHSEFLGILGVTEIVIGVALLVNARYGGLLASMLLLGITINLLLLGDYYNIVLLNIIVALTCLSISPLVRRPKPPPVPPPLSLKKAGKK